MTDLFHQWKQQRFAIIDPDLLDNPTGPVVLMSDLEFWSNHVAECLEWCQEHNCKIKGMTIELPDDKILTLFSLRWAG